MSLLTCVECSTQYAVGIDACPHCGSPEASQEGVVMKRLPLFVAVSCACGRSWKLRLNQVQSGLVELPSLFCASCGRQALVPWPPVEDSMPKITAHGGATNARVEAGPSPDASASPPLVGAEADQGHPTPPAAELSEVPESAPGQVEAALPEGSMDYNAMTLTELRTLATDRGLPAYGTKSQIAARLRAADGDPA